MINYIFSIIFITIMYYILGEVFKKQWRDNGWMNAPVKKLTSLENWTIVIAMASFPVLRWLVMFMMVAAAFYTPEELKEKLNIQEDE